MCSMGFAPKSNGEVVDLQFNKPEIIASNRVDLNYIEKMVELFWGFLAKEPKISKELEYFIKTFKEELNLVIAHAKKVHLLLGLMG